MKLRRIRSILLLFLICLAPLSKYPSISTPVFNFPSFRIGVYQLLAIGFVASNLPLLWCQRHKILHKKIVAIALSVMLFLIIFGVYVSLVPKRSMLYGMSFSALALLLLCGYATYQELSLRQRGQLVTSLLLSACVFSVLTIIELVIVTFSSTTPGILCTGCSSTVFGFPRINLFAAEPQFFANSLLPAFFASIFLHRGKKSKMATATLILTSVAIALTFSRGAFLAIATALGCCGAVVLATRNSVWIRKLLYAGLLSITAFLVGFLLLLISASHLYRSSPHITYNTFVSMLDQLSMGTISLQQKTVPAALPKPTPQTNPVLTEIPTPTTTTETTTQSFVPEGFVEESSNDRMAAARLAINAWNDSPRTVLFGVGTGNLGAYVNKHIAIAPNNLTVYIFYILVLSEMGILGLLLVCLPFLIVLRNVRRIHAASDRLFVLSITVAFMTQFLFFGSYINSMYIWLWFGVLLAFNWNKAGKNSIITKDEE